MRDHGCMAGDSKFGGIALAFGNRKFRIYTLSSIPSQLGTWIQRLAVAWLAWKLTQSHAWVGAVAMADMLPVVFLAPLAGAFADRLDRLKVSRLLQIASMTQAIILAALAYADLIGIEILILLTLVLGILQALFPLSQLDLGGRAHPQDGHPSRELGRPLLQFLAIIV